MGSDEDWNDATAALAAAAEGKGLELVMDEGGGAFYGPKIDVQARDAIGRHWQVSTIQVDLQPAPALRPRVCGADNGRHQPVMIHRALFGSVERFFAILLEHYAGALPTWLMPRRWSSCPSATTTTPTPSRWPRRVGSAGVRAASDPADEPLRARIRKWKMEKIPYILVVGDEDVGSATVGVNARGYKGRPDRGVALDAFMAAVLAEIESKGSPGRVAPRPVGVSLEQLWAGWRHDYVAGASAAERTGNDDECVFCRIAASGDPSADNGVVWRTGSSHSPS